MSDPYMEIDINDSRFEDLVWEWLQKDYNAKMVLEELMGEYWEDVENEVIKVIKDNFDDYASFEFSEEINKYVVDNIGFIVDDMIRLNGKMYEKFLENLMEVEYEKVVEFVLNKISGGR